MVRKALHGAEVVVDEFVEFGGPEQFRLDELVRQALRARQDPREVVADDGARYFGAALTEHMLLPGAGAVLFQTRFEEWLGAVPA